VLGAFPDSTYQQGEIVLQSGDRLVLFTDGITEVRNAAGEEFGEARLRQLLTGEHARSAADLQQLVMDRVTKFCAGHFEDDAALMVVEVK
jgi:sigma-B regulation protein RsbU (phosphoserine phosphatase)